MPHSVLPVPAHRPLRGSSPGATRRVQGQQPIDGIAVVDERVDQHVVVDDVLLELLVAPARQGRDLDLALLGVPADHRRDHAVVGLGAPQAGRPGVVLGQRVGERLDLAQLAAQVGVGLVEVLAVLGVLLGHALDGGDGEQVDRQRRLDGVAGADGLDEVVAGVEEDHVDAGRDLRREVGQHGVAHRGGDAEALAEGRHGPLDDVLGGRELELGADVGDQRPQLLGRTALGVGAPELPRGTCGGGAHRGDPRGTGDLAEVGHAEGAQAAAALPAVLAREEGVVLAAVGAVQRALVTAAHADQPPTLSPRSSSSSARTTQSANSSPSSRSARKLVTTLLM